MRQPGGSAFPAEPADQYEPADQAEQREQAGRDHQYQDEPDKLPELAVSPVRERPGRPAQERHDRAEPAPPAAPLEDLDLLRQRGTPPARSPENAPRSSTSSRSRRSMRLKASVSVPATEARPTARAALVDGALSGSVQSTPCAGSPAARTSMASRSTHASSSRVSGRS